MIAEFFVCFLQKINFTECKLLIYAEEYRKAAVTVDETIQGDQFEMKLTGLGDPQNVNSQFEVNNPEHICGNMTDVTSCDLGKIY